MDYQAGKLYLVTLKPNYSGFIPFQKGSLQDYPLKRLGEIPDKTLILFAGYSYDKYSSVYLKVIYQDKVGVVSPSWATLKEP